MFIPTTTTSGWVSWEIPHRYAVVYPTTGLLAGPTPHAAADPPAAVSALIGPVRADILSRLGEPRTTTQLAALTGHSLGSVSGHLKTLLAAHLLHRRRSGRSVLYYRTSLGDDLVNPRA